MPVQDTPKVGQRVIMPREFAAVNPADLERLAARLHDEALRRHGATALPLRIRLHGVGTIGLLLL